MPSLTSRTVADSYKELLKLGSVYSSPTTLRQVEDGDGNALPVQISQSVVKVTGDIDLATALTLNYPITSTWNATTPAITVASTLPSTSHSTGALTVAGGVGIGDDLNVLGTLNVTSSSNFTQLATFANDVIINGTLTVRGSTISIGDADTDSISFTADINSNLIPNTNAFSIGSAAKPWNQLHTVGVNTGTISATTSATLSPAAGTVTISPLVLTINPNTTNATSTINNVSIGDTTPRKGTFTSIVQSGVLGNVELQGTTDSSSPLTGTLTTDGGMGIAKNLYVGGSLNVPANAVTANTINFAAPLSVTSASAFTGVVKVNTAAGAVPLTIQNAGADAVTVDAAGQLNVLKTSVHTGKATFLGVTEVNNVLQQVNAASTSTFAGSLTLNNATTGLTVNGPAKFRGFTGVKADGTSVTLTYANDTGNLTATGAFSADSLSIGGGDFTASNTGFLTTNDGVSFVAGVNNATAPVSDRSLVFTGALGATAPAVATKYLKLRSHKETNSDFVKVDFGDRRTTLAGRVDFDYTTFGGAAGVGSSILPFSDNLYDLGSATKRWGSAIFAQNLTIGGLINATNTGASPHVIAGNLEIRGDLKVTGTNESQVSASLSSTSKQIFVNQPAQTTSISKLTQNLASVSSGSGLFVAATMPTYATNLIAVANSGSETFTHDHQVPIASVVAKRVDTTPATDISNLLTFTTPTANTVTITWSATALTTLTGTSGAVGRILFEFTPQAQYGYFKGNSVAVAPNAIENITHNLKTASTALTVKVTKAADDSEVSPTTYAVTQISVDQIRITWGATATAAAVNELNIAVGPTLVVQKSSSFTYATAETQTVVGSGKKLEPQFLSTEHINLAADKSFFIGNSRVLSATALAAGVVSSSLTKVGRIGGQTNETTNYWAGNIIAGEFGGTGAANTGKILTLGGSLTTTGAFTTSLAATANTTLTLPVTGTLATLAGAESLTNKTLSSGITISSGALGSNPLSVNNGGTGRTALTQNCVLFGNGTNLVNETLAPTANQILVATPTPSFPSGVPTFKTLSPTITLVGDVTGTGTMTDLGNVSITTTVGADKVALGTDTTGNFTESVAVSGSGLAITNATPLADGAKYTIDSNATANNTASTIVFRDASGNFSAGAITAQSFLGNATTASSAAKWTTTRTLTLGGDLSGSVSVDGSGDIALNASIVGLTISNADVSNTAAILDTKLDTISSSGKVSNSATTATSCTGIIDQDSSFIKNTIVARDALGGITVNTIKALQGVDGIASGVVDNVSIQKVIVSGFDGEGAAASSTAKEIVFSSNSNCSVFVSEDASGEKTNVFFAVPLASEYLNDFNDANFIVSDDASGGRIQFKLDSLSSASSSSSASAPRQLIVSDNNQTILGYTNASPLAGTPGNLTTFPFLTWDKAPQCLEVKIAGQDNASTPVTAYIPFTTAS